RGDGYGPSGLPQRLTAQRRAGARQCGTASAWRSRPWGRGEAVPTVAHGPARLGKTGVQGGVADERRGPELPAQLLLGDDTVAMGEEIDEHLAHFGAHVDGLPGALHLTALRVEAISAKDVEHAHSPLDGPGVVAGRRAGHSSSPSLHHIRAYQDNTRI